MDSEEVVSATAVIGREHYRTELRTRTHVITGDEPVDVGGTDLGPRPGDFLRMSLASCTAITLRMYADRKKYDVNKISVTVSNGPMTEKSTYTTAIHIEGNLSGEEKDRLIQIAKRCPVHKILMNPIEIITELTTTP
jgi:putative redox protein